jgi:hypothetical protein
MSEQDALWRTHRCLNKSSDGVTSHTSRGESGRYATLSHPWETVDQHTNTTADIKAHENGIEVQALPKSFQEAIAVTRKLGIRYLWIDSLWYVLVNTRNRILADTV